MEKRQKTLVGIVKSHFLLIRLLFACFGYGMVWHGALVVTYAEAFKHQKEAEDNGFLVL